MDKFGKKSKHSNIDTELDLNESGVRESGQILGNKRPREAEATKTSASATEIKAPMTTEEKRQRLLDSQTKFDEAVNRCKEINPDLAAYERECMAVIEVWRSRQQRCRICDGCGHTVKDCPWLKALLVAAKVVDPSMLPYLYMLKSADWLEITKRYSK